MKFEVLEKEIRGSLFEEILLAMSEDSSFEELNELKKDEEEYLDEMNLREKALLTVRNKNQKKCETAIFRGDYWIAHQFNDAASTAQKMLWESINRRFGSEKRNGFGIRKPWAIVALGEKDEHAHYIKIAILD